MASRLSIASALRDTGALIARFPLPVLISLILVILYWGAFERNHSVPMPKADAALFALRPFWAAAFIATFAAALLGERIGRTAGFLAAAAGLILSAVICDIYRWLPLLGSSAAYENDARTTRWQQLPQELFPPAAWYFLSGSFLLLLILAPFATRKPSSPAFWQFSHKFLLAAATGVIGCYLAFLGVAAVLATFELLFEVPVLWDKWVPKILVIGNLGIAPVIWLLLTPADFEDVPRRGAEREMTSRTVSFLVRYILIPVVVAISLLFMAYVVKVLATGAFTTARLGLSGLVYGAGIVLVAMLAYPERDERASVRLFWRLWPFFLIVPTVLALIALKVRIDEYGWSIFRYLAFLAALWLIAVIAASFLWRKEPNLRIIPASLAALLFAAAIGPWGVADTVGRSQAARFEALLAQTGAIKNGKWDEGTPLDLAHWPKNDLQTLRGTISELDRVGQLSRLASLFEGSATSPLTAPNPRAALEARLNLDDAWRRTAPTPQNRIGQNAEPAKPTLPAVTIPQNSRPYFRLNAPRSPLAMQIENSWLLGPFSLAAVSSSATACFPEGCAELHQDKFLIDVTLKETADSAQLSPTRFDLAPLVGANSEDMANKTRILERKQALSLRGDNASAVLEIVSLNVNMGEKIDILSGDYYVVVSKSALHEPLPKDIR